MDFVVSKVAMAMCALMVVTVLASLFDAGVLMGGSREFERVLGEFCRLVQRAAVAGCDSSILWETPYLPDGKSVSISIQKGTVLLEAEDGSAAERPAFGVHIWNSDGRCLNESMVQSLDEESGSLVFESGQTVEIVAKSLIYEDELRTFVFVYLAEPRFFENSSASLVTVSANNSTSLRVL